MTVTPGDVGAIEAGIEKVLSDYPRFKAAAVRRAADLRRTMTWERVADAVVAALTPGAGARGGA